MVAYNFQERFVPAIVQGSKRQTIRRIGKRRHAEPGDQLQLYTGMRTTQCRKILEEDPTCLTVRPVEIRISEQWISVIVEGTPVRDLEAFARQDGFDDATQFHRFWKRFNKGPGVVDHLLITWG